VQSLAGCPPSAVRDRALLHAFRACETKRFLNVSSSSSGVAFYDTHFERGK